MKNKGWVKLWRNQFNNWVSKKPFCDGYAWCYLYQRASHKKGLINFRNEYIKIERGQFLTSKLQLQKIFGWTYRHVENFLKALENDEMVRNRITNRYIVITIVNYSKYQSKEEQDVEQNEEQIMNRLGTDEEQIRNEATQTRIIKNGKNGNNTSSSKPRKVFDLESIQYKLALRLWGKIKENNPNAKQPNLQLWAYHIDLMIRMDKRDPIVIDWIINWCQANPFWSTNILSTQKLRKQFDQLWLKAKKDKKQKFDWKNFKLKEE